MLLIEFFQRCVVGCLGASDIFRISPSTSVSEFTFEAAGELGIVARIMLADKVGAGRHGMGFGLPFLIVSDREYAARLENSDNWVAEDPVPYECPIGVVGDVYETSDEEDIGASDGLGDMRCDVAQGTWTA